MEETGPPGIVCWSVLAEVLAVSTATTVGTVFEAWKFWIVPWLRKTMAKTKLIGSRMRVVERTVSTQKLPSVRERRRISPRTKAMPTAMPTAADRNCWTTRPNIWLRWLIVDSPA